MLASRQGYPDFEFQYSSRQRAFEVLSLTFERVWLLQVLLALVGPGENFIHYPNVPMGSRGPYFPPYKK
jgi:hypothetical protein